MSRPHRQLPALAAIVACLAAPCVAAQQVSTRSFRDLSSTDGAGNTSRSVPWAIDLSMGETVQITTCAEVLAGARNDGNTVIRLTTDALSPLDAADDGCGEDGRGTSLVFTAGSTMKVIAWLGCHRDTACGGVAALRTDRNANGNAADLPAAIRALGPIRHSRIYTHAGGVDHPDSYPARGETGDAHARVITRIPRGLVGEDFLVAYRDDGGGTAFYLRHGREDVPAGDRFHRSGSPLIDPLNVSHAQQAGLSGRGRVRDRPGGGQRFGRYLVIAETDSSGAGDTGYRNAFHELLVADAAGRVVRRLRAVGREDGGGDVLYAAITKLQGFDAAKDAMFPHGYARAYLVANLRRADAGDGGGGPVIDFWMLRPDRHGWFDPASFVAPSAPWYTWNASELLPSGAPMEAAGNGDLFTDREGRVWLVHYHVSSAFGLGNPWFQTPQDTVSLYRVHFQDQPTGAGGTCARPVCIERTDVEAGTISGGEGDGGLSPDDSFAGAASGYLAPPAGEALFVYSSEYGDDGGDRFRVYEWAPPGQR